ncbi:MAG: nuclear transport factor 2 family protein [Ferrovibrio sp.]|jgi:hypothetical protein|uniref:nuclear transport factor 2 family protein n=1 Tax=Ferrovibrio sp. TaxID=1917215 RepID=UPI00391B2A37
MTRNDAERFAAAWAMAWNAVDIDAVVAHLALDAEMRSPLAQRLTGQPSVQGRENIRAYWVKAYGHIKHPNLRLEACSWDDGLRRLTVWWQADLPSGTTRASEYMDFDDDGLVRRSEAYYGAA